MKDFTPKWIVCLKNTDSYKYECKTHYEKVMDGKVHTICNTYRFVGKPLRYLIKKKEDYDEMISLPIFEDYVAPSEKPVSAPSETPKQRKLREAAEAKANAESNTPVPVPASQTDSAESITDKPESD